MIDFSYNPGLLEHCSYFALSRNVQPAVFDKEYLDSLIIAPETSNFHPQRKEEFILGRYCASKAFELHCGQKLIHLPTGKAREPLWPVNTVGSISHNQHWVGAVVASGSKLLGVGVDFETMGRVKPELGSYILNDTDVKSAIGFSSEEIRTIIFSAKESLYKALYPSVRTFFGFDSAAVTHIDSDKNIFTIKLLTHLSSEFSPSQRSQFTGRFVCDSQTCLTAIEITH